MTVHDTTPPSHAELTHTTPRQALVDLAQPVFAVRDDAGVSLVHRPSPEHLVLTASGALEPQHLGDPTFATSHGVRFPMMAGAMANGIASADLVIAMAKAGYLGSFGAAGLLPEKISEALDRFDTEIGTGAYACNLIHSPSEERLEQAAVELFLARGVRCVEASAFLDLTPHIVRYRVAGLRRGPGGEVVAQNRVIAKISRPETAAKFLAPAPAAMVSALVEAGAITAQQAELARLVPMADDVTVEGDSGGHTDRRPLHALLPAILRQRAEAARATGWRARVGAAGGIGTPGAAAAAFAAGADYVVTGSVNQACVESGASAATRRLLAQAEVTDCEMAPAADMFELGVDLQVLRRGTMFPMRARRLHDLYRTYDGLEALPAAERERLEQQIFRAPLTEIWDTCREYFSRRDPAQIERAGSDPKKRMALVFRWYLGMSSRWSNIGQEDRVMDYQIWCGPAMGAFNEWVSGTYLETPENRRVAEVAHHLLTGAAYETRVHQLRVAGIQLAAGDATYIPSPLTPNALEAT